jgi:hypothetical protein
MDEIVVYYAFYNNKSVEKEQYNFFELKNLRKYFINLQDKTNKNRIFMCPSFIERTKNIFYFEIPYNIYIDSTNVDNFVTVFNKVDNGGIKNAKHIILPFSLLLFSEKNLDVLFSSPYCHKISHNNAFVPPTKLNIGSWYRPFNVQYLTFDDSVVFLKDEPLVYLEFLTEDKIVFKEYTIPPTFEKNISTFVFPSGSKYISLKDRYKTFNSSNFKNNIINLCKTNLRKVL